MIILVIKVS